MTLTKLNLFATLVNLLSLFVAASAQTNPTASTPQDAQPMKVSRHGVQAPQMREVENFTGAVGVETIFDAANPSQVTGARVTFAQGARTAWHTHPRGQTLIVTAGTGWVQQWGGERQEVKPGDVVRIQPN